MAKMSHPEMEYFRKILEQRRGELEEVRETGNQSAGTVELDQSRVGRLSRMDAMQSQAISKETNRRRIIELQRISSALERLANNEFGICASCGEEILKERLELDPSTPVCLDCAG